MRRLLVCVTALAAIAWASSAVAELCSKCQGKFPLPPAGKCDGCGKEVDSTALKLCPKCSTDRRQCELCLTKLEGAPSGLAEKRPAESLPADKWRPAEQSAPAEKPPTESPPAEKPPEPLPVETPPGATPIEKPDITPIDELPEAKPAPAAPSQDTAPPARLDPSKPGTYHSGKWQYRLDVTDQGTRSEGRWGWLWYDGQKLPRGEINDYYVTPWGAIYWVDVPKTRWGSHGWMISPAPQGNRRGRMLNAAAAPAAPTGTAKPQPAVPPQPPQPAARAAQTLEVTKADSGKRARLRPGHMIVVRLPGNPTTGFQWQAAAMSGHAMRLVGRPQYVPTQSSDGKAGSGGTYVFQFQAVQPGNTALKLFYARPWERTKAPSETFTLNVEVLGQAPGAAGPPGSTPAARPAPASRASTGQGGLLQGIFGGR